MRRPQTDLALLSAGYQPLPHPSAHHRCVKGGLIGYSEGSLTQGPNVSSAAPLDTCVIPPRTLVVMVAPAASGKSTWLARHFPPQAIISSDALRGVICDDPGAQEGGDDVFRLMHELAIARARRGHLTCLDATHLGGKDREAVRVVAEKAGVEILWLCYHTTREIMGIRNRGRERRVPERALDRHWARRESAIQDLRIPRPGEQLAFVGDDTVPEIQAPMDGLVRLDAPRVQVMGDVHGCAQEFRELLLQSGWILEDFDADGLPTKVTPPAPGTLLVSVGDLVDRGPDSMGALKLMRRLMDLGHAHMVMGNHDGKFLRALRPGNTVQRTHGLEETVGDFEKLPAEERDALQTWLTGQPVALAITVSGHPTLWVSHAGVPQKWTERWPSGGKRIADRLMYGDSEGTDPTNGLPIRSYEWTEAYPADGEILACYGHTPHWEANAMGGTLNLDTGAPFGGSLTLYDTETRRLVSVKSRVRYAEPIRTMAHAPSPYQAPSLSQTPVAARKAATR